jgi:hypothetical protein
MIHICAPDARVKSSKRVERQLKVWMRWWQEERGHLRDDSGIDRKRQHEKAGCRARDECHSWKIKASWSSSQCYVC